MLRLTTELGQPVRCADGRALGDLVDLTVRLGAGHPTVHRLAVGHRSRITHLVDWTVVVSFEHTLVQLAVEDDEAPGVQVVADGPQLGPLELLLRRDVLDTQIIDVTGHRVERVGDVLLVRTDDDRLEAAAVDVGFGAVVRRLGFDGLADHLAEKAVDWADLHLTSERGHEVQLATPAAAMHGLDAYELAHLVARLPTEHAADVLAAVHPERAAAALRLSHPEVGTRVSLALEEEEAAPVLEALPGRGARHLRHLRRDRTVRRRFTRHRGWRRFLPARTRRPGHAGGQHDWLDGEGEGDHGRGTG